MLHDLLSLEKFYGKTESALYFRDLCKRYGEDCVHQAIEQGHLILHIICIGEDYGRRLCWLSDGGKNIAQHH